MRIFVSVGFNSCIKKNYKIISKEVAVIDIESITKELSITDYKTNIYSRFILNEEIKKKFNYFYVSKRFKDILYVTKDLDENVIKNLKSFLDENKIYFTEFILIDYFMNIDSKLYSEFQNVI